MTYFSQTDGYIIWDWPYCQMYKAYMYCTHIGNTCSCQCHSGYILVNSYCLMNGNVTYFFLFNVSNNPSLLFYIKNCLFYPVTLQEWWPFVYTPSLIRRNSHILLYRWVLYLGRESLLRVSAELFVRVIIGSFFIMLLHLFALHFNFWTNMLEL